MCGALDIFGSVIGSIDENLVSVQNLISGDLVAFGSKFTFVLIICKLFGASAGSDFVGLPFVDSEAYIIPVFRYVSVRQVVKVEFCRVLTLYSGAVLGPVPLDVAARLTFKLACQET